MNKSYSKYEFMFGYSVVVYFFFFFFFDFKPGELWPQATMAISILWEEGLWLVDEYE